jgi:hypothetical protein
VTNQVIAPFALKRVRLISRHETRMAKPPRDPPVADREPSTDVPMCCPSMTTTTVSSICGFSTPAAVCRDLIAKEVLGRETGKAIDPNRGFAMAR